MPTLMYTLYHSSVTCLFSVYPILSLSLVWILRLSFLPPPCVFHLHCLSEHHCSINKDPLTPNKLYYLTPEKMCNVDPLSVESFLAVKPAAVWFTVVLAILCSKPSECFCETVSSVKQLTWLTLTFNIQHNFTAVTVLTTQAHAHIHAIKNYVLASFS